MTLKASFLKYIGYNPCVIWSKMGCFAHFYHANRDIKAMGGISGKIC